MKKQAKKPAPKKKLAAPKKAAAKKAAPRKTAAKAAPRKVPTNRAVQAELLRMRGSGLVELAIAADRERRDPSHPPKPLTRAEIAQLAMPDGREIPPSLATWLAYDRLDIFEPKGKAPRLRWRSFDGMMREQFDDETAARYAAFGGLLTGQCLALPDAGDSRSFLYAGEPDAHGEYPVFIVDTDELAWVGLAYPGFDAYIADGRVASVVTESYLDAWEHDHWAPHLEHHSRTNFGGLRELSARS